MLIKHVPCVILFFYFDDKYHTKNATVLDVDAALKMLAISKAENA